MLEDVLEQYLAARKRQAEHLRCLAVCEWRLRVLEAEAELEAAKAVGDDGKPLYTNEAARKAAAVVALSHNDKYLEILAELHNEKYSAAVADAEARRYELEVRSLLVEPPIQVDGR